ncbi:sulfite exporter TauE/SafE family protein [Actibacterium ureilyticum]|uniref:sulfite exporter TauE/SafE family protein n=1 Tax=Actibacterium ureilyticum TaxID=1590614 RepID=UPI0015953730|nr:sulfite exporter TauE/SafE family protein [Actibacterium ureilyticum]
MSAAFQSALATPGLVWLVLAVALAGVVRGFSGFGSAMIFMPVAASILPPVWAVAAMSIFDIIGPVPNLPGAWRDGHRRNILRMIGGAMIALPLGIAVLTRLPVVPFRWTVSVTVLILLAVLISGWRYRRALSAKAWWAIGALGGALAGSTGLAGPPVVLFHMAGDKAADVIRANLLVYLFVVDVLILAVLSASGLLALVPVLIGALLAPVYLLANLAGAALFQRAGGRRYRGIAFAIIGVSAVLALPVLD